MTLPRYPEKLEEAALVTPAATIDYFYDEPPAAPDAVVLCFHDELFDHVAEVEATTPIGGFGEGFALEATDGAVGVVRVPGVGAPSAALAVEDLVARGTETFVPVGHVGAIDPDLRVGDVVVVDRALRDEGTSHHYLEADRYVAADGAVVEALDSALEAAGVAPVIGPTWTTDAPFRETGGEVERYRAEGILTVDMEAAAVFAVATYRGVRAAAAFTISDVLDPGGWEPAFDRTPGHLEELLEPVIETLAAERD